MLKQTRRLKILMPRFPKKILIDTGFWFAFYTPDDRYRSSVMSQANVLETRSVLIPWPSLYETINTRFTKQKIAITRFRDLLKKEHVQRISDEPYREEALDMALNSSRNISLVDMVIRLILDDINVPKDALLTVNPKDFHDVCTSRNIEMVDVR